MSTNLFCGENIWKSKILTFPFILRNFYFLAIAWEVLPCVGSVILVPILSNETDLFYFSTDYVWIWYQIMYIHWYQLADCNPEGGKKKHTGCNWKKIMIPG